MKERAATAEKAAENDRNKELYSITNTIAGERRRREGVLTTESQERFQI